MSIIQLQCREYMGHVGPDISKDKNFSGDPWPSASTREIISCVNSNVYCFSHSLVCWWKTLLVYLQPIPTGSTNAVILLCMIKLACYATSFNGKIPKEHVYENVQKNIKNHKVFCYGPIWKIENTYVIEYCNKAETFAFLKTCDMQRPLIPLKSILTGRFLL